MMEKYSAVKKDVIDICHKNGIELFFKYDPAAAMDDDYTYYIRAEYDGDELWTLSDVDWGQLWQRTYDILGLTIKDGWIRVT